MAMNTNLNRLAKSLRLLIETAKHVGVPSYERLAEASFGKMGFNTISFAMFIMSYGAMVGYMIIIKTNLSHLLGVGADDVELTRAVLAVSTLCIILPLSVQRDMSNLSKTSAISVIFDCFLVGIVACFSPVSKTVADAGGWSVILSNSSPDISTFFTGIGVLCFAFVCQHSAFIIAASLEKPTRSRWNMVTGLALGTCAMLASIMGVTGYLGFMDDTDGDILINMGRASMTSGEAFQRATNVGRGLLCTTMFFVYPMELFVARHVCVVLFFKGRRAHEGDDHSVLARNDRRVRVTVALYMITLIPATVFDDLGSVFSVTGSLGGSVLSYIGPGLTYLGVHGSEFLELASKRWDYVQTKDTEAHAVPRRGALHPIDIEAGGGLQKSVSKNVIQRFFDCVLWYALLMPVWTRVAIIGRDSLRKHKEDEALKSPMPLALGKIVHNKRTVPRNLMKPMQISQHSYLDTDERKPLIRTLSSPIIKDTIGIQTKFDVNTKLPPLAPSRKGKVGFSLGQSHSAANEKIQLDRSRPITPDSFAAASFEVLRETQDSYGATSNTILQQEVKELQRTSSANFSEVGESSCSNRSDGGLTSYDDEDESQGTSIFMDANDDVSSEHSGESSVHVNSVRSIQSARQNLRLIDEIPKFLSLDKVEAHPSKEEEEEDPQDNMPSLFDFVLAIFYVLFGFVAAFAGLYSSLF